MITFQDLCNHGLDVVGNDAARTEIRSVADAAQMAMRSLQDTAEWRYYRRTQIQPLNTTVQNVGLVTFTFATLVVVWDQPLPAWFGRGCAMIDGTNNSYTVRSLVAGSSTSFYLDAGSNPGSDQTFAGGTMNLCQYAYDLPLDFRSVVSVGMSNGSFLRLINIASGTMAEYRRRNFVTGTPRMFDIIGSTAAAGKYALNVWPIPNTSQALSVFYKRYARPLRLRDYSIGTITAAAGSAAVTGNGTAWNRSMIGSVIRLTDTDAVPTSYGDYNPYLEELTVDAVAGPTSLTTTFPVQNTYVKRRYIISDPVDVPDGFVNFLYRLMEKEIRLIKRMPTAIDEQAAFNYSLIQAQETDNQYVSGETGYPVWMRAPLYLYRDSLG